MKEMKCQNVAERSFNRTSRHRAVSLQGAQLLLFSVLLKTASEALLEIKSGEGGDDAKLFVGELFAAISKFAVSKSLRLTLLTSTTGHIAARVEGKGVWRVLSPEIGTHCIQRIPPTETKGRRHTSYVSVAVLPIVDQQITPLDMREVEVTTQGGHGKGGQHQNKSDSAVRMKHRPTGLTVFINGRKQVANKAEALRVLTARVNDHQRQKSDAEYLHLRQSQFGSSGRGQKIRTYNFMDGRAVDYRTNKRSNVKSIVAKGEFDGLR